MCFKSQIKNKKYQIESKIQKYKSKILFLIFEISFVI